MSTNLVLDLDGEVLSETSDKLNVHYQIEEDQLKVYVPKELFQQDSSYRSQLPLLFRNILGIESEAANYPISLVLQADINILDDIMKEWDIDQIEWIEKPQLSSYLIEESNAEALRSAAISISASPPIDISNHVKEGEPISSSNMASAAFMPLSSMSPKINTASEVGTETILVEETVRVSGQYSSNAVPVGTIRNSYRCLLDQIIKKVNDGKETWEMTDIRNVLPENVDGEEIQNIAIIFGDRNLDRFAHDSKIGAAGELFVSVVSLSQN
jgi:hypothetical protein